jgi:hypothetical protein
MWHVDFLVLSIFRKMPKIISLSMNDLSFKNEKKRVVELYELLAKSYALVL